jgi:TonB family protein
MTGAGLLSWLAEASIVLGVVVTIVLVTGRIARGRIGAGWIYALWLAVPAALLASLAPNGMVDSPLSLTVWADASGMAGRARPDAAGGAAAAISFAAVAVFVWLAVAAALLLHSWRAQRRFERAVVAPARAPNAAEATTLTDAAAGTGLDAARDFRFTGALDGPLACGLARPVVLLPEEFVARYAAHERRVMVLHEAEHISGRHLQHRAAAAALRCLFWFHPLAWLGERAFLADQEMACDQAVLGSDAAIGPKTYAATLLKAAGDIARGAPRPPAASTPLIAINHLKGRTAMLTRHASLKGTRASGLAMLGAVASAAVLAGLSAIAPAHAQEDEPKTKDFMPMIRVPPAYPPEAVEGGIEGNCVMGYDIDAQGTPQNIEAVQCTDDVFAAASIEAVRRWRFDPETAGGTSGEQVVIDFQLEDDSDSENE